jgi:hypothetical protein
MNRPAARLVDLASRMLDDDERNAVCGDLEEARIDGLRALRDVLGLVGRRQLLAWAGWRPWLALALVIAPLGTLLSLVSRFWAYNGAIYAWLYVNNWTTAYLDSPGSRVEVAGHAAEFLLASLTLAGWSWTSGFVVAALARRSMWLCAALFCLVIFGPFGAIPQTSDQHAAVFTLTFYRVVFPLLVRAALVVIPFLCGLWIGRRRAALPALKATLWPLALVAATALTMRGLEMSAAAWLHARSAWLHLLPVVMLWPAGFILFTARKARSCDTAS